MITYTDSGDHVRPDQIVGFFVDWPDPPSSETHLRVLHGSTHIHLAVDSDTGKIVGFITAVSDGVLSAYIPLLEVLPDYQGRGIGSELVRRMLATLEHIYMVDLLCDPELQPFYARLGLVSATAMFRRNYHRQSGTD